jgi:hypothetical protein
MKITDQHRNPDYGSMTFRRSIRLTNRPGETTGELEDSMHAMRGRLIHDGTKVIRIDSDFVRYPLTTCPGAASMIDGLAGLDLATPIGRFYEEARRHCTHMHDVSWWMMSHARRDTATRLYEASVPDHPRGRAIEARLLVDGEQRHCWTICDDVILAPEPFSGQRLIHGGFVGWAIETFEGDALEEVLVLHKAYLISLSHLIQPPPGPVQDFEKEFDGVCWSYSRPRSDDAVRLGSFRHFPEGEGLLEFRP